MKTGNSAKLFEEAQKYIPGGVNSPVRAFKAVGLEPLFIKKAYGCRIVDEDDNEYIDFVGSWGPLILGHAHPRVVEAVEGAARKGTSFGAPCAAEIELARMITEAFPAIDMVRMVNSGTEAALSAIRLARAYTGRDKIVKFEGCYHGHSDSFLIKAGSGLITAGVTSSPGVPEDLARHTLVAQYNDKSSVEKIFAAYGKEIAAVIVEPIPGNMGLVLPEEGFLEMLRGISENYGSLLIFDEVITGFRLNYGGYQNMAGLKPDLTVLGKIIGGGLPVGAYGGRREIMNMVAPAGEVYQAGTLSGNPLAMAAGAAGLQMLKAGGFYEKMAEKTQLYIKELKNLFVKRKMPVVINHIGSMFTVFFSDKYINNYQSAVSCDTVKFADYFRCLLNKGIYIPPSQFELSFISAAHDGEDIEEALKRTEQALKLLDN
ncbi:MAG: glutamate-1-semialdehyde 2,1-aminomutase [Syntrophomonadaceae bacterium]|jgi:glutamate-1-semialdehyde 2,1-aminomutase|nr:glutamate-1-semialdehyde 2,1-aminomutase [Syntrophomonadaceae bacterium]